MGYGPRQGVRDKAWAVLNRLVCACKNKNTTGKRCLYRKEKSHQTIREAVMVITLRWSRQSGCRVQYGARPGNQMIRRLWKGSLFPLSFFWVFSCVLLFLPLLSKALACLQNCKTYQYFFWWSSPDVAHRKVRKASDTVQRWESENAVSGNRGTDRTESFAVSLRWDWLIYKIQL